MEEVGSLRKEPGQSGRMHPTRTDERNIPLMLQAAAMGIIPTLNHIKSLPIPPLTVTIVVVRSMEMEDEQLGRRSARRTA